MGTPKMSKKQSLRVMYWDDERGIGNSLIVTLNYGYRFDEDGCHVKGFDTIKEALSDVSNTVQCNCKECAEHLPFVS